MKLNRVKEGDVYYWHVAYKAGNTTITALSCYRVVIKGICKDIRTNNIVAVSVSWNGNPVETWSVGVAEKRLKRAPIEYAKYDPMRGPICHECSGSKDKGHSYDCPHPRAIVSRKRVAKSKNQAKTITL